MTIAKTSKIEWMKLGGTVLSALLSAVIVGSVWYSSINLRIGLAEANIVDTKIALETHCNQAEAKMANFSAQIYQSKTDAAVSQALLREIALRLERIENRLDKNIK